MKRNFFSLLVSLVFIPVTIIANIAGFYIGKFYYWIVITVMSIPLPQYAVKLGLYLFSGWLAGFLSASSCKKIYKNYNFKYTILIPAIIISVLCFVYIYYFFLKVGLPSYLFSTSTSDTMHLFIKDFITILCFVYYLKNNSTN